MQTPEFYEFVMPHDKRELRFLIRWSSDEGTVHPGRPMGITGTLKSSRGRQKAIPKQCDVASNLIALQMEERAIG